MHITRRFFLKAASLCVGILNYRFSSASDAIDIREFGAVCDGVADDAQAIQLAIDFSAQRKMTVVGCPGVARITKPIFLRSNTIFNLNGLTVKFDGELSNPVYGYNQSSPFFLGFWSPAHNGRRKVGETSEFDRKVDFYACRDILDRCSTFVDLVDDSVSDLFKAGEIYFIRSAEYFIQKSTGEEIELPVDSSLVKVTRTQGRRVHFESPVGFDTKSPPWLCRIKHGATEHGLPIHFVQNVEVFGGHIVGRVAVGSNNTGAYRCKFHDFTCDVTHVVQANGFAYCEIYGFSANFKGRVVEAKFCSHNSIIRDFSAFDKIGSGSAGMFSIGEGAKALLITRFHVSAINYSGPNVHVFQIQYGADCEFHQGLVIAPLVSSAAVNFYSSKYKAPRHNKIRGVSLFHGSRISILFSGDGYCPDSNVVEDCVFHTTARSGMAIALNCGVNNRFERNRFSSGVLRLSRAAVNNFIVNNIVSEAWVGDFGVNNNKVIDNYILPD